MEKLLTIQELSQILNYKPRTLYEWTHMDFIPHYKFSKGVRFKASEVEKWMRKRRVRGRISYKINL